MRIAYLILAHRYPEHIIRLIQRLDDLTVSFFLHVDSKADARVFAPLQAALSDRPNVHFVKRHRCRWGGFGVVRATMSGLREVVESRVAFDYLALLSGQDYPIKTNAQIRSFLERHEGMSFVHHNPFPYYDWVGQNGGWDRVKLWHFRPDDRHLVYPRKRGFRWRPLEIAWNTAVDLLPYERTFPAGLHPYGGAQFWCLHRAHVRCVYDFIRSNPRFVRFFRFVNIPDEIFFQTIVANTVDGAELHNDSLTLVPWNRPGATLVSSDFDAIRMSRYLFARKFDATVDADIVYRIDREILAADTGDVARLGER